jgi:hypothetical protein
VPERVDADQERRAGRQKEANYRSPYSAKQRSQQITRDDQAWSNPRGHSGALKDCSRLVCSDLIETGWSLTFLRAIRAYALVRDWLRDRSIVSHLDTAVRKHPEQRVVGPLEASRNGPHPQSVVALSSPPPVGSGVHLVIGAVEGELKNNSAISAEVFAIIFLTYVARSNGYELVSGEIRVCPRWPLGPAK